MNREQAIDAIRESPLSQHADLLIEQLLPSARLVVHDGAATGIDDPCASHFGGLPSLPGGTSWPRWDKDDYLHAQMARREEQLKKNPRATMMRDLVARMREELSQGPRPLAFLGQLSLRTLHAVAPLPGWPPAGTLAFFYDVSQDWGFDPQARGHCRALYSPEHEDLAPVTAPADLPDEAKFPERSLSFTPEWSLPAHCGIDDESAIPGNDDYGELTRRLMSAASEREPIHRCGGHPQQIQGDMRLQCQLVTNGLYCGNSTGYRDPRRALLEAGAADWQLLLQIDSDQERLGWMWGDAGRVYYWIRRQDLESADFDGAWALLQCY